MGRIHSVGDVVHLDFGKDRALTSHGFLCSQIVKSMREGIKHGCDFPLASLWYSVPGDLFYLNEGSHRARAHSEEGALLAGRVEGIFGLKRGFIPLWRASLVDIDSSNSFVYGYRVKESLSHLPPDVASRFCEENNLDPSVYLSQ